MKIAKIKSKNKLCVINIESKPTFQGRYRSLTNVSLEDGTKLFVCDSDLEILGEVDDRAEEVEE